jgi:hypothetical protein
MLAVGAMQVFWRYVLQNSLSGRKKLLRYLYVWVTMTGHLHGNSPKKGWPASSSGADYIEKKEDENRARRACRLQFYGAESRTFVFIGTTSA